MLNIGDIVLYKRKRQIHEWEINQFSPSRKYVAIENSEYDEHWVHVSEILEVIETEHGPIPPADIDIEDVIEASKQPIGRLGSTKDYVRSGPAQDRFKSNEV